MGGDTPFSELVWTSAETTLVAQTTISGLTRDLRYYFRCQTTTRKGVGNWSSVIPFIVV